MSYLAFIAAAGPSGRVVYEGENLTPGGGVSGAPVTAKNSLLSRLTVSADDSFESGHSLFDFIDGTTADANGVSGTFTTTSSAAFYANTPFVGLYPTQGSYFAQIGGDDPTVLITFSTPVAAFWLYMTDVGDEGAQVTMTLSITGGGTVDIDVTHSTGTSGTLVFWGFVDDTNTYDSVLITISNTSEAIAIDQVGMATPAQLS